MGNDKDSALGLAEVALGSFTTDAEGLVDIPVDISTSTLSAQVSCGPYGYDTHASVLSLVDPSGASVYDAAQPFEGAYRFVESDDILPLLFPVIPGTLEEGSWVFKLQVGSGGSRTLSCALLEREEASLKEEVPLSLEVIFVGVEEQISGLNATGAEVNAAFMELMGEFKARFALAGLEIDPVIYTDFSGDTAGYTSLEDREEIGALLRTTVGTPGRLTIFVVQSLKEASTAQNTWGSSPGLISTTGTSRSGLVLSIAELSTDPTGLGRELARAGLSFFGLFPPTEPDGSGQDPLSDTPFCSSDENADGSLSSEECKENGAENLLWWSIPGTEVSEQQGIVVRQHPAL
jgi:hypothetical protein